ncbi:MAG: TIGR03936 family radical SAM-associated protein [Firmicutes bacterium]|nr:TIGR03936 family radical SAM-associated protein [Bacillota bacterium]
MIILKFEKLNPASFMAHLDVMRCFNMALRRAKVKVKYSTGFNPHMLVFFSSPLAVGLESRAEYVCVDTNDSAEVVIKNLSKTLPNGIKILSAKAAVNNPNFASVLAVARYEVELDKEIDLKPILDKILSSKTFNMDFEKMVKDRGRERKEIVSKDVRDRILDLSGDGKKYNFLLLCGNLNLRADKLVECLLTEANNSQVGYKVIKTEAFMLKNKKDKLEDLWLINKLPSVLISFDEI